MLKKMMLLASMALAAIAFTVPASASAQVWNGSHEDSLTGFIAFGNPAPGGTKFGCFVHAGIDVAGGTTTGQLTSFEPTTSTCEGEGSYAGCKLVEDSVTVPADTTIHLTGTNTSTLTTPVHVIEEEELKTPMVVHYVYDANCPIAKTTLTVEDAALMGTNSNLTDTTLAATGVMHAWLRGAPQPLPPATVALFGTLGTASDTITMSEQ